MKDLKLLIVDDDEMVIQALRRAISPSWHVTTASTPSDPELEKGFHAAFVDIHLSPPSTKTEGLDIMAKLSHQHPHLEIVAMSGDLDRQNMEHALKAGASRFLAKPLHLDEVRLTLDKIEAHLLLQGALARSSRIKQKWIGSSESSKQTLRRIADFKGEKGALLIEGESGCGKEVVARLLNQQEGERPLIVVNMAALPDNLFESELFGHAKGSFTGADQNRMGLAEAAHEGDLFLDEIEALPLAAQAKLLRFLETGEVRRVGSKDAVMVQTRVIAATNKNLSEMVKAGEFREDLLWRLQGKKINLTPLRERREELPELCVFFLSQDRIRKKEFTTEALSLMSKYDWPGNVRELKRLCEHLLLTTPLPIIRPEDVRPYLHSGFSPAKSGNEEALDLSRGLAQLLNDHERRILLQCMARHEEIEDAAKTLGISRSSLYKKIRDHDINWRGQ